ncbi:MAG TPA: four helix bundle protein [Kofleriaceae bacterium]|nr:four helix bundle protein [Kofleriaceae bacterium]
MTRDPNKLEAFVLADALVIEVYRATKDLPMEERYGLQSQLRRGAVSVAANLVEGASRHSERDYAHFVAIAQGSASEVRYLVTVAARLDLLDDRIAQQLTHEYGRVVQMLQRLEGFFRRAASTGDGRRTTDDGD